MTRASLVILALLSLLFGACSKEDAKHKVIDQDTGKPIGIVPIQAGPPTAAALSSSKFQAGQVWAFKRPANQPNAKLTILRIEDGGKVGTIVHVALSGVSYGNGQTTIPHLPFAESAIAQSITTLERESGPVPDFDEGYRMWREAFDAGKGGIFTITVADAFDTVTGVIREHK